MLHPALKQPSQSLAAVNTNPLPAGVQDVAMFLMSRGPYAWLGHNGAGCIPEVLDRPAELDVDYGTPIDDYCRETATGSGIFQRRWTKGRVTMDCNSWSGSLPVAP